MPGWLIAKWEWLQASDPGLSRLRTAGSAAVAMAAALAVEFGFAALIGASAKDRLIGMLLGAVVAMMGSNALLAAEGFRTKVRTAAWFPIAMGAAMLLGVAVGGNTDLMLAVFVAVMFVAMFVRRFGTGFFFLGFMGWIGYFFASFMHATLAMMPFLVSAVAIASAWVLLLSLTVLRVNPTRTLERTVRSFDARARGLLRACAELLESAGAGDPRGRRRLRRAIHNQQHHLIEAALMVEGWLAAPGALPPARATTLRRELIDAQQALDALAEMTQTLAEVGGGLAAAAGNIARRLAYRKDQAAMRAIREWQKALARPGAGLRNRTGEDDAQRAAWRFANAARVFVRLARAARCLATNADAPPAAEAGGFAPAVGLVMGNLPGSASVAHDVSARGAKWNPLARLDLTTRQAIQVAVAGGVAIVAGRALSPTRYYWAVIAAFIMFSGTATRSETFIKGFNRVLGTLVGLAVAIVLAEVNAGHPSRIILTILGSMFLGLYLIRISYAYMIFFITIIVAQLYTVFGEFTPGLLLVRLEETAVGAALGFLVALFFVPLSTRDTARVAREAVLGSLAELLDAAAGQLRRDSNGQAANADAASCNDGGQPADLYALSRELDDHVRRFALVAKPLTGPLLGGGSFMKTRRRLRLYATAARDARALVVELNGAGSGYDGDQLAGVCRDLATAAKRLAAEGPSHGGAALAQPLAVAEKWLAGGDRGAAGNQDPDRVTQSLGQLLYVFKALGTLP